MTIEAFSIEAYDRVLALWQKCEGVGLSQADSRPAIEAYLETAIPASPDRIGG